MPERSSTALITGLLVLTAVSVATLTFVRRARLRRKYLSSSEGRTGSGSSSAPAVGGVGPVPAAGSRDTGGGAQEPASPREGENAEQQKEEEKEEEGLPALLTASPPCWQNPLVLGFNKLKPRTTLGAFSSAQEARWV